MKRRRFSVNLNIIKKKLFTGFANNAMAVFLPGFRICIQNWMDPDSAGTSKF